MIQTYCKTVASAVLGRNISVRFLVPEGEDLPCLFLLHGYDGDQDQWVNRSRIAQIAQAYNLAVVMPGCGNGYYEDTQEDMPRFLGEELVLYARNELPISGSREKMYIAGVSMGGFGALLVGAKYSEVFGKAASFSGALIIHDVAIGNQGVLGNANVAYFRSVFGDFSTLVGSTRDPIAEMTRAAKSGKAPELCIVCGREDLLYNANEKAVKALKESGASVVWYSGEGSHQWPFWNDMLPQVVQWLVDRNKPSE